jgi:hypothetical protein
MLEVDEQVQKMLDLVIERKLRLNKVGQTRCLDNEEDEEDKIHIETPKQTYKLEECCCIE